MKHITLTIPRNDVDALRAAATMLWVLADKLDKTAPVAGRAASLRDDSHIGPCIRPDSPDSEQPDSDEAGDTSAPDSEQPDSDGAGAAQAPDVDADGLPWDARIHAGSKTTTKDGRWKRKRGVDSALVEQVESELQQLMAIPAGGNNPEADTAAPPPPPAAPAAPAASEPVTPPPPAAPTAPAAEAEQPKAPEQPADAPETFPAFLKATAGLIRDQRITTDQVNEIVRAEGVESMHLVSSRPDLIPKLWGLISEKAGG